MLYDPKWEKTTKADPVSLAALIAWLETQPPTQAYDWPVVGDCLACHYLVAIGRKGVRNDEPRYRDIFDGVENYHRIAAPEPWTYGAALKRARTAMPR